VREGAREVRQRKEQLWRSEKESEPELETEPASKGVCS